MKRRRMLTRVSMVLGLLICLFLFKSSVLAENGGQPDFRDNSGEATSGETASGINRQEEDKHYLPGQSHFNAGPLTIPSALAAVSAKGEDETTMPGGTTPPSDAVSDTPSAGCTYAISAGTQSFPSTGGSGRISVLTKTNCPWTASPSAAWVTIDSTRSASGSGTISYSLSANEGTASRTAQITVEGQVFSVTQAGAPDIVQYALMVKKTGNGQGTVASNPAGTLFNKGASVTLNANPGTGSVFSGWSGACSGTSQTCSVKVNSATYVTASFSLKTFTISVSTPSNGIIYPSGPVNVPYGGKRTFQVIPLPGHRVSDVLVDRVSVGAVNSYTFNNIVADHLIQATFVKQ